MKKMLSLSILLAFMVTFTSCGGSDQQMDIDPTTSSPLADNTQKPLEGQPKEPLSHVSIATAEEWNEFAQEYNDSREKYTEEVNIEITRRLDFAGIEFIPLYGETHLNIYAGRLPVSFDWESAKREYDQNFATYEGASGGNGFYNISKVKEVEGFPVRTHPYWPTFSEADEDENHSIHSAYKDTGDEPVSISLGLFGTRCRSISVSGIMFVGITADFLLCRDADTMTLNNVSIERCNGSSSLLAYTAGEVSIKNLHVYHAEIDNSHQSAGLLLWVKHSLNIEGLIMVNTHIYARPDAGSGTGMADASFLVNRVFGTASYNNVAIYYGKIIGLSASVLGVSVNHVGRCENISVVKCSLLGYGSESFIFGPSDTDILFYTVQDKPLFDLPVFEKNINIEESMFYARSKLDAYRERGYCINNCIDCEPF